MKKNSVEVLLSTMNQSTFEIYNTMNIKTDALIINQAHKFQYEEVYIFNNKVRMYTFDEKGIGISRNSALIRAKNDICILADDDLVYEDNYAELISDAFSENKSADIIIFNVKIIDKNGIRNKVKRNGRTHWYNSLKYGAVSIAFRRNSIEKVNIKFSSLFGGGSKYGSGEDSIFIWESLKKGLKIYTNKNTIATVYNDNSSWFEGYNEKYLFDKGALFMAMSPWFYLPLNLQFALKNRSNYKDKINFRKMLKIMNKGSENYKFNVY